MFDFYCYGALKRSKVEYGLCFLITLPIVFLDMHMIRFGSIRSKVLLVGMILLTGLNGNAQFVTSQNGPWLFPSTWVGDTVPLLTDSVIINHNVILTTDWGLAVGGSITINPGASLSENIPGRAFFQSGGAFINNGTFEISNLWVDGGFVMNGDSMHIIEGLYNGSIFTNNGSIEDVDSIWNDGTWVNGLDGNLTGAMVYITDSLFNNGIVGCITLVNEGSVLNIGLMATSLFYTQGDFENGVGGAIHATDFWNANDFVNDGGAELNVTRDFFNADSNIFGLNAVFYNDGFVGVGNNWYNTDGIDGLIGQFCIAGLSANTGVITGTLDICDLTPTTPTLDIPGTIGGFVTHCTGPCNMVVSSSINKVTCNLDCDGSITLTVYGGTPPYTYLWDSGNTTSSLANLCEDVYVIQVDDAAGDSVLVLVSLYTPPLDLSLTSTLETCGYANGSALATVSGGTAPYNYAWSDSLMQTTALATDLSSGTYAPTVVDNNGCLASGTVTVSQSPALTFTKSITASTCFTTPDGVINITVAGGTQPYTYLWSSPMITGPSTFGLEAGDYSVTITDSDSCILIADITVPAESGPDCTDWKIFSGITPNGDGVDDQWEIRGLNQYDRVGVQIFTNRGVIVWQSEQYENNWEGTDDDGNPLIEGIYYYIVTRPEEVDKGWIHILR